MLESKHEKHQLYFFGNPVSPHLFAPSLIPFNSSNFTVFNSILTLFSLPHTQYIHTHPLLYIYLYHFNYCHTHHSSLFLKIQVFPHNYCALIHPYHHPHTHIFNYFHHFNIFNYWAWCLNLILQNSILRVLHLFLGPDYDTSHLRFICDGSIK